MWHTGPVIAHRHHRITVGVAHYDVWAARVAAAASAMRLSVADTRAWLT